MKASFKDNVLTITTTIAASALPVVIKDKDDKQALFAFSKDKYPKVSDTQFVGNSVVDGNLAYQQLITDPDITDDKIKKSFGTTLALAQRYEEAATKIAEAKEANATALAQEAAAIFA